MTEERSPYAAPESDVETPLHDGDYELASRWNRLGGAIIDGIIIMIPMFALMFATGYWTRAMTGEVGLSDQLVMTVAGLLAYALIHGYLLATSGQTVGKRLLGMRIVSVKNNEILPLGRLLLLRYVPVYVAGLIPLIGGLISLINVLFIFGAERRCVHDLIAGTRVIKTRPEDQED